MKDPLALVRAEGEAREDQLWRGLLVQGHIKEKEGGMISRITYKRDSIDGRDSPEPVRPMDRKGLVDSRGRVDVEGIISPRQHVHGFGDGGLSYFERE